jgi:pimeloyl-ACP methyl ester carboxylesterase
MWVSLFTFSLFIPINAALIWICLIPIIIIDLWLSFTLGLMFILPIQRKTPDIPDHLIFEEQDIDGYPVRWLRTSMDNGKPLAILIHGWNSRSLNMEGRSNIYIDSGYNVLLFEMRAHGGNKPVDHWAAMHVCHDFEKVMELYSDNGWLENGFIVHGHSMGGFIAQRGLRVELETSSNLKGVILESPVTSYSLINNRTCEVLRIPEVLHPWMMKRLLRHYNSMNDSVYHIKDIEFLESPNWGLPDAPTLLIQAKFDTTLGQKHWKHLVDVHSRCDSNFTYHIVEELKHSQERTNKERDQLILDWMDEESLIF